MGCQHGWGRLGQSSIEPARCVNSFPNVSVFMTGVIILPLFFCVKLSLSMAKQMKPHHVYMRFRASGGRQYLLEMSLRQSDMPTISLFMEILL